VIDPLSPPCGDHPTLTSVIIPCFNERYRLRTTLDDVVAVVRNGKHPVEIVVVDDASNDGTSDLVLEMMKSIPELRLVRLGYNAGKGGTVRAGMLAARGARRAFIDADGAVPFGEMARLEAALDAGADIAVGSRVTNPALVDALLHRRFFGFFFRALVRALVVRTVQDTQCGFKLFRSEAAITLFAEQRVSGFAFDVEVLGRAERLGLRIAEIGVRWRERSGSKVRVLSDGLTMAGDVLRLRGYLGRPPCR
jgi:dolichyl-phosphate beta-glucosyltransferase